MTHPNDDLLACPFCGGADIFLDAESTPFFVLCMGCQVEGPFGNTVEDAHRKWNTRAKDEAKGGEAVIDAKYDNVLVPFAALMAKELHANAGKGDRPGWLKMSAAVGMLEIYYHTAKLQKSVKDGDGDHIREYAADVANMAMMLLDVCGGLDIIADSPRPTADDAKVIKLPDRVHETNDTVEGEVTTDGIYGVGWRDGWNECLDAVKKSIDAAMAERGEK